MTARSTSCARSVAFATLATIAVAACADESSAPDVGGVDITARATTTTITSSPAIPPAPTGSTRDAPTSSTPDPPTSSKPDLPTGSTPDPPTGSGQQPEGFTTIRALITDADGEVCEVCLWLADDAAERARGLMGVTDLGDPVGMAFRFDDASTGRFYMFQTPTPLSIAWFGSDGAFVASTDMEPCLDTPAGECPRYSPDESFDLAIEVFDGGLGPLGLGPGSYVELIEGSEAERCAAASSRRANSVTAPL